ncbi:MAG: hypothetical protein QOC56_871, partial [Alphaproteobacteria bacterium]|nr:hypothetical protein [Alphaproteobacteria bacterium]
MKKWQMQDTKAKFAEVVRRASPPQADLGVSVLNPWTGQDGGRRRGVPRPLLRRDAHLGRRRAYVGV